MDFFAATAQPFVFQPLRFAIVALAFLALALISLALRPTRPRARLWPATVPLVCWVLAALNEYGAKVHNADIRLDLLLGWPVLLLLSLVCIGFWIDGVLRRAAPSEGR